MKRPAREGLCKHRALDARRGHEAFQTGAERVRNTGDPVFIYVGRVSVEKNIEEFLQLDLPGSKVVVGDGPERKRLEAAYPNVRFTGMLEGEALASAYRSADVFVFPSKTDTFGLVLLEAMASGLPVAAFPVMGPADVIGAPQAAVCSARICGRPRLMRSRYRRSDASITLRVSDGTKA